MILQVKTINFFKSLQFFSQENSQHQEEFPNNVKMTPNQYSTSEQVEPLLSSPQENEQQQGKMVAVTAKVDQFKVEEHGLETFDMLQYVTKVSVFMFYTN